MAIRRLALLLFLLTGTGFSAHADEPVRLVGFQALLFNSQTGTFSTDVLAKGGPELGNIPASPFAPATFVIVQVQIAKGTSISKSMGVRLIATESGSTPFAATPTKQRAREVLNRTARLGAIAQDGSSYVGFWISDITACQSIALKASVIGVKTPSTITAVLPFTCYE